MKKEDEVFFSGKLNEMADKFNKAIVRNAGGACCPGSSCFEVDPALAREANDFASNLYGKFKAAGYNDDDWKALEDSSGAGRRMQEFGRRLQ